MSSPAVKIGKYLIRNIVVRAGEKSPYYDRDDIWIERDGGEGMSISQDIMGEWLDKFYKEHF